MLKRFVAVVLLFSTFVITAPVSAADFNTPKTLGSVSGSGGVRVRGSTVSPEGTLFSGDHVAVGSNGTARVMLTNGGRIVLDRSTDLTFGKTGELQLTKGNAAFNTKNTGIDILAGNFSIKGNAAVSGNVAFVGSNAIGLRITSGTATVRNLTTKETYQVSAGQERLFSFTNSDAKAPIAQLASNMPTPIPAVPPAPQVPQSPAKGLTTSGWIAILATIGGAAAAIAVLATRGNNDEDTAAIISRQKALQAAATAASTASQASTTANQVASAANTTNTAIANSTINAATKATLTAQATAISSQATATQQQIASLNTQLTQLQAQLANATDQAAINSITAQINTVIASLNQQTAILNQQIAALNTLVAQATAAGVQGVPTVTITPIPPVPQVASASVPV